MLDANEGRARDSAVVRVALVVGESGSPSEVGRKAAGLRRLPSGWVPPFIVLRAELTGSRARRGLTSIVLDDRLIGAAAELLHLSPRGLILRSSALIEDLAARGAFTSVTVDELGALSGAIRAVLRQALTVPDFADQTILPMVLQQRIEPRRLGHLANTRRVARDRRTWRVEIEPVGEFPAVAKSIRQGTAKVTTELPCARVREIPVTLRSVAVALGAIDARFHCEWVWDGTRIFVVQADDEAVPALPRPGSSKVIGLHPVQASRLTAFKPSPNALAEWPKLKSVEMYRQAELPSGAVFVLEGASFMRELASGRIPEMVERDLAYLTSGPTVIRSDVLSGAASNLLRPRTAERLDAAAAGAFLVQTAVDFVGEGLAPEEFAFVIHRFIPASASAWSLAVPGHPSVLIDSTWGLPDGLLMYPHDSFEVAGDGRILDRKLRCKTKIIDFRSDGSFFTRDAGRPWDWKRSLTSAELAAVAQASTHIARVAAAPIETMFFVGVSEKLSPSGVLPWFSTMDITTTTPLQPTEAHFGAAAFTIASRADLLEFSTRSVANPAWARRVALRLEPSVELLRDEGFLGEIASAAVAASCHVEFNGSLLSHAWAIFQRHGVSVRAFDPHRARGQRITYNKLVRDFVPESIVRGGEQVRTVNVDNRRLHRLLMQKLLEEAIEARQASSREDLLEELADVVEVVAAVAANADRSLGDVLEAARAKRDSRGGFNEGTVLVETRLSSAADAAGKSPDSGALAATAMQLSPRVVRSHRASDDQPVRLILPLALPIVESESMSFVLPVGAEENARITYYPDRIQLEIAPREPPVNPNQLRLDIGLDEE